MSDRKRNRESSDVHDVRTRMFVMTFIHEDGNYNIYVAKHSDLTEIQIEKLRQLDGHAPYDEYDTIYRDLDDEGLWWKEVDGKMVRNEIWTSVEKIKDAVTEEGQYVELDDIVTFTDWC